MQIIKKYKHKQKDTQTNKHKNNDARKRQTREETRRQTKRPCVGVMERLERPHVTAGLGMSRAWCLPSTFTARLVSRDRAATHGREGL